MAASKRAFRTPASLDSEAISRDAAKPFLESRGLKVISDERTDAGTAHSQIVSAIDLDGSPLKMRVRLCWRWDEERRVSAAQLRARLIDGDWDKTLDFVVSRDMTEGVSHSLLLQRFGSDFRFAALIPVSELKSIWLAQRDASKKVIDGGLMGRIRKNHAMNGDSPTMWLMDTRTPHAHAVSDVLWNWPGVRDLALLPLVPGEAPNDGDDTFEDLPGLDYELIGSEGASRSVGRRSFVKRDPRVRRRVAARAIDGCERFSCPDKRRYPGFLDVHHVLGVDTSDRYWNCVALCPSCHREAHFGPAREALNAELLAFAAKFRTVVREDVA